MSISFKQLNNKINSIRFNERLVWIAIKSIIQTITGNAPLILTNAVNNSITSLTQYGKCTQNGTPMPSAPVDIMCNNGTLRMVDEELPSGYKRITGIKFDGDFWYDTGEVLTGDDDVTMTLANTVTTGQNVFGSYNGTSSGTKNFSLYIYGGGSSSNSYFRYGEQLLRPRFGSNERTITLGGDGTTGFASDVTATVAGAFIGMLPNSTQPAYTGTIVGNILVGTRLKWIPCERESDGVVGYYEAVKGVFLEPVGTGTPVKGDYDFSLSHIDAVGTPEVLTVTDEDSNAQTASVADLFAVGDYADTHELISGVVKHKGKVLVLDGTEDWYTSASFLSGMYNLTLTDLYAEKTTVTTNRKTPYCTHFERATSWISVGNRVNKVQAMSNVTQTECVIGLGYGTATAAGVENFKAWLAAQYAAGTPVIVVYPLAEVTTEQTTAQSLTTSEGTNTINVTAEVNPIKLEVEYYSSPE